MLGEASDLLDVIAAVHKDDVRETRFALALGGVIYKAYIVDALLLDAYHPHVTNPGLLGGTGKTLNWNSLKQFRPRCPWLLAGGITPDNVLDALQQLQPDGIDLSSGIEVAPGDKDLAAVERLFVNLQCCLKVSKNA